jgi:hypothetical protein
MYIGQTALRIILLEKLIVAELVKKFPPFRVAILAAALH